jgi:tRNA 2-selenouridine synthase
MDPIAIQARVPAASAAQVLEARDLLVIDLRTASEYAEDHLPGAVNVPLFDDVGRALIGTLYRRESPERAFGEARELARERIAGLVEEIGRASDWRPPRADLRRELEHWTSGGIEAFDGALEAEPLDRLPEDAVVLHCWRGGLRSRSVVAFGRALGLERAVLLAGGYKAYRRAVIEGLAGWEAPPAFVLRGLTGVGKTLVLREIERIQPGWTVDLEALAGHRSSILGMVGLEPRSQKAFETGLCARLREGFPAEVVVFEGESRKVGDAIIPGGVWRALHGGANLELVAAPERRVEVLVEDYLEHPSSRGELRRQLPFIERRLGARWEGDLVARLDAGRECELAALLLERYYDPLYRHSEGRRSYAASFDSSNPARAAEQIAAWISIRG